MIDAFYPGDQAFESAYDRESHIRLNGGVDVDRDWIPEPFYHGDLVAAFAFRAGVEILSERR